MTNPSVSPSRKMRASAIARLLLAVTFAVFSCGGGATPTTRVPDNIEGVVTLDALGLIDLVRQMPDLVIIDSRIPGDREEGYIERSVSLPDTETSCESLATRIPSLDTPTAFYCNGVKCGRSVVAIRIAKSCDYNHLYWYRGGFADWQQNDFPYIPD